MNDVTIPHVSMYWENTLCFRDGRYGFRKLQKVEHWITLCEINSIKTDDQDGYIINRDLVHALLHTGTSWYYSQGKLSLSLSLSLFTVYHQRDVCTLIFCALTCVSLPLWTMNAFLLLTSLSALWRSQSSYPYCVK